MKIRGTDFGIKYFFANIDGVDVTVEFRMGFFKGVHDANIRINDRKRHNVKIKGQYPGFFGVLAEVLLHIFPKLSDPYKRLYNLNDRITKGSSHYTN